MNTKRSWRDFLLNPLKVVFCSFTLVFAVFTQSHAEDLDLLITGPEEFRYPLEQLVEHKIKMGLTCRFMSLETMLKLNGKDDAEKVKNGLFLLLASSNLKSVFIVGDADKFPVRYCARAQDAPIRDHPKYYGFTASDLYYADLVHWKNDDFDHNDGMYSTWNHSSLNEIDKMYWGQTHKDGEVNYDELDMIPEIAVGRLPASTVDEVQSYVYKVIDFETRPHFDRSALIVGKDKDIWSRHACERMADLFLSSGLVARRLYAEELIGSQEVIRSLDAPDALHNELSEGALFMFLNAHGRPDGWSFFGSSQVRELRETDVLPVMFINSCDVGRFAVKTGTRYIDIEGEVNNGSGSMLNMFNYRQLDGRLLNNHNESLSHHMSSSDIPFSEFGYNEHDIEKIQLFSMADGDNRDYVVVAHPYESASGKQMLEVAIRNSTTSVAIERFSERASSKLGTGKFERLRSQPYESVVLATRDAIGPNSIVEIFGIQPGMIGGTPGFDLQLSAYWSIDNFHINDVKVGDFNGDYWDEIAVWGRTVSGDGYLFILEWGQGFNLDVVATQKISLLDIGEMAIGNIDDDRNEEIVITCWDGKKRVTALVYESDSSFKLTRSHEARIPNATVTQAIAMGNMNEQDRDEIVLSSLGNDGNLTAHVFEVQPGMRTLNEIANVGFEGCEFPVLEVVSLANSSVGQMHYSFQDGLKRARTMVFELGAHNVLNRISDFAGDKLTVPIAVTTADLDQQGEDQLCLMTFRNEEYPTPPNPIQSSVYDNDCITENFLLDDAGKGAIAVVSCTTGSQSWGNDLAYEFFSGYKEGNRVIGEMWKNSIIEYFNQHPRGSLSVTEAHRRENKRWTVGAEFFQPAKFTLFGDPSIRLK